MPVASVVPGMLYSASHGAVVVTIVVLKDKERVVDAGKLLVVVGELVDDVGELVDDVGELVDDAGELHWALQPEMLPLASYLTR